MRNSKKVVGLEMKKLEETLKKKKIAMLKAEDLLEAFGLVVDEKTWGISLIFNKTECVIASYTNRGVLTESKNEVNRLF